MRRFAYACLAALAALIASAPARAGDFVDTRLNFTITDESILVKPNETTPSVPGLRIGMPNSLGILFFDNWDTRFSGYENLSHLVLYKNIDHGGHFQAEAALVLRFLEFTDVNLSTIDDGSYLKVTWWRDVARSDHGNLSLTAFPMSADRMRLGYSYKISWGGSPVFFKFNPDLPQGSSAFVQNTNPAPGAKLQWAQDRFYAWAGAKSTVLLNRANARQESVWAGLAGVGVDVTRMLRLEANGGVFDRGANQKQEVLGKQVTLYGGSAQIALHRGMPVTSSTDYALYRNDPTGISSFFRPEQYPGGLAWLVMAEGTLTAQTLQDPDHPQTTTNQAATAGDLNVRVKWNHTRLRLDAAYRSLAFVLLNVPSFVPYQDFPDEGTAAAQVEPDLLISFGGDQNFSGLGLTVGATLGIDRPASFTPPKGQPLPPAIAGNAAADPGNTLATSTTVVVRNEGDFSILKPGTSPVPIFALKLTGREDFNDLFAAILDVYYVHDENRTQLRTGAMPGDLPVRDFVEPNQIGFNLTLQARF
jgi:hypothetical protein